MEVSTRILRMLREVKAEPRFNLERNRWELYGPSLDPEDHFMANGADENAWIEYLWALQMRGRFSGC